MLRLLILELLDQSSSPRLRILEPIMPVIIWIEDKLEETGCNKELLELTNDKFFVGDTRHLMMRAM
jgi:hypothetical protein